MQLDQINHQDFSILVVDSDNAIRFSVCDTLRCSGFRVLEAKTGEHGLDLFYQIKPDMVLLDLALQDLDGFRLCQQIRAKEHGSHIPIMIMTQRDDVESIVLAFEAGATDFITKPLHHVILEQRIRYMLRTSQAVKALREREQRLENAERIAQLGSWEWDSKTRHMFVSREFNRILGFVPEHPTSVSDVLNAMPINERKKLVHYFQQKGSRQQGTIALEHAFNGLDGIRRMVRHEAEFINHDDKHYTVIGTIHDITEEVIHKEQILQLAYYDPLTGLPNRTFFKAHLEFAIRQARASGHPLAIIVLDLDLFTRVNNSLGHEAGDELLKQVSERMLQGFDVKDGTRLVHAAIDPQSTDTSMTDKLARLEGDQFVILMNHFSKLDNIILLIQKLFKRLSTPFTLRGNSVVLTASAGVALYPVNGQGSEMLLRNADAAMHFAKNQGRNNFRFYSSDIDTKSKERLSIENDLRHAIRHNELELHYQPKVHLKNRDVRTVEALLRWRHPVKGMISPAQFVPMAEELGLINDLGVWLLHEACRQTRMWNEQGLPPIRTAINLSPIQIRSGTVVEAVRNALEKNGLIPSQLEVEITETVLLEDTQRVMRTLEGLRSLGVKVALDDFGTGYSSLSYLTRFPFTSLKIDRCFVTDCVRNAQSASIVHTIIQLCKNLNLEVVAEGVETEEELTFLFKHRCDLIQGFYFSPALDADSLARFIRRRSWIDQLDDLN